MVTPFPTIAVGTVVHAPAVELRQAFHLRQLVDHAGGEKELPGAESETSSALDRKTTRRAAGIHHLTPVKLYRGIPSYVFPGNKEKFGGANTVAREITVESTGPGVAWLARIADEHAPPAAAQHQGPTEPCRSASYYQTIVRHLSYARPAMGRAPAMTSPESITCLNRRRSSATCFEGSSPSSFATTAPTFPAGGS
jgi:hypothetical protein